MVELFPLHINFYHSIQSLPFPPVSLSLFQRHSASAFFSQCVASHDQDGLKVVLMST